MLLRASETVHTQTTPSRLVRAVRVVRGHAGAFLTPLVIWAMLWVGWDALVGTGSDPGVVRHWALVAGVGVMLPGFVLMRALHPRAGAWADTLAYAGPVGLVLQLLAWAAGHLVGSRLDPVWVGAGLTAFLCLLPWTRRRTLRLTPTDGRWSPLMVLTVGCAVALSLRAASSAGLQVVTPKPTLSSPGYHQDYMYHAGLVGELRRTLTPGYPFVNGEPLSYHWFYYAQAAQLAPVREDLDVIVRILPLTLLAMLVLVAASVGRQVAGSGLGGGLAALMVAGASPVLIDGWAPEPSTMMRTYWISSPTQTLAWVFGMALLGAVIAMVRRAPEDAFVAPWLAIPLAFAATGSKSSQVPVIAAGVAMVFGIVVIGLLGRAAYGRELAGAGGALVILALATLFGVLVLYPRGAGIELDPILSRHPWVMMVMPGEDPASAAWVREFAPEVPTVAFLRWGLAVLAPCAGILALLRIRRKDATGWIGLGIAIAGVCGILLFAHPGFSQLYFLVSAYPLLLALSGAGIALALTTAWAWVCRQPPARAALLIPLAPVTAGVALWAALQPKEMFSPAQLLYYRNAIQPRTLEITVEPYLHAWLEPTGRFLVVLLLTAVGVWLAAWLLAWRRPAAGLVAGMTAIGLVAAGTPSMWVDATRISIDKVSPLIGWQSSSSFLEVSPALYDAAQVVKAQAAPSDVVATNRVYSNTRGNLQPREFAVAGLTGLRTDVSGWGYATRTLDEAQRVGTSYTRIAFWDQHRLAAEMALMTHPTPEGLAAAYRNRGVRWIIADERAGKVDPGLAQLADEVFNRDGVHAYRLRAPASSTPSIDYPPEAAPSPTPTPSPSLSK